MRVHYRSSRTPSFTRHEPTGLPPDAYNLAVLPVGDRYAYAVRDQGDRIVAGYLDQEYRRVGHPQLLGLSQNIDPRLTWWQDRVWMTTRYYGRWDWWRQELWPMTSEMRVDDAAVTGGRTWKFLVVHDWPGYERRREANWTPFVESGELFYVHTFCPHRVLRVDRETRTVHLAAETSFEPLSWNVKGASEYRLNTTPARLPDGTYLAMVHIKVEETWYYYNGFYRYEGRAPWRVLGMSPIPALLPDHAYGPLLRHPQRCVFPVSLQAEGDLVRVAGGSNDSRAIILHFSLKEVLDSLHPVY